MMQKYCKEKEIRTWWPCLRVMVKALLPALLFALLIYLPAGATSQDEDSAHTFLWMAKNANAQSNYGIITLEDGNTRLIARPRMNLPRNFDAVINVSHGSENEPPLPPGAIEVRIPLHAFAGRDGQPVDSLRTGVPLYPNTSNESPFQYRIENHGDTDPWNDQVVISNFKTLDYAGNSALEFGWHLPYSSLVPDGTADDNPADGYEKTLKATFTVTRENPQDPENPTVFYKESELYLRHDTTASLNSVSKSGAMLEEWPAELGEPRPEFADVDDYFYVRWSVSYVPSQYNTQPYWIKVDDVHTLPANPAMYDMIGYKELATVQSNGQTSGKIIQATYDEYMQTQPVQDIIQPSSNNKTQSGIFYFRYHKSLLQAFEGYTGYELENTFKVTLDGYEDAYSHKETTAKLLFKIANYDPPEGYSNVTKTGKGIHQGFINLMNDKALGDTTPILLFNSSYNFSPKDAYPFKIISTARAPGLTYDGVTGQYMKRPWTTTITDNKLYLITMEPDNQMEPEDFDIHSINITYTDYELVPSVLTGMKEQLKSIEDHTLLYLSYQNAAGTWVNYGTVKLYAKTSQRSTYTHTKPDGSTANYSSDWPYGITLPKGAKGYKITSDPKNISSQINISASMQIALYPSDTVMASIAGNIEEQFVYNEVLMEMHDADGNLYMTRQDNDYFKLTRFLVTSTIEKMIMAPTQANDVYTFPVLVQAYERVALGSATLDELKEIALPDHREFIFHDLLPLGADVDTASVRVTQNEVRTGGGYLSAKDMEIVSLERIPDYQGSGRVMLKVQAKMPSSWSENYYVPVMGTSYQYLYTGANLLYNMKYPFFSVSEWGGRLTNHVAYRLLLDREGNDNMVQGQPDISPWPHDPSTHPHMSDLDGGGTNPSQKNFLYTSANYLLNRYLNTSLGYEKLVKGEEDEEFSTLSLVAAGGSYTYRLRLLNYDTAKTQDLVFFDTLEAARPDLDHWQGTLVGIDTRQPYLRGIDPRVYYSTQALKPRVTPGHDNLLDTSLWTLWNGDAAELAQARTVAVDMSLDRNGNPFILGPLEALSIYLHMQAPPNPIPYLDPVIYAHNNSLYAGALVTTGGDVPVPVLEQGNTVRVQLRHTVSLDKSSEPPSGTAEAPTVVLVDDTIIYRLDVKNTNTAAAITGIRLVDNIPEGLQIQLPVELMIDGDPTSRKPLAEHGGLVQASIQGQEMVFNIPKLEANQVYTFFVTSKVEDLQNGQEEVIYENTASITQVFQTDYPLQSEPTYHQSTSVLLGLQGHKRLEGRADKPLEAEEFFFLLTPLDGIEQPSFRVGNQADGSIVFPELRFNQAGQYRFELKEELPSPLPGHFQMDENVYLARITVTQDEDTGLLTSSLSWLMDGQPVEEATFVNQYQALPITVVLEGSKRLEGRLPLEEGMFSFGLFATGQTEALQHVSNQGDGRFSFQALSFDSPGEYHYEIREILPEPPAGGLVYDRQPAAVLITVSDNLEGALIAQVSYQKDGESQATPLFINRYELQALDLPLRVHKELEGRELQAGQFSFVLRDEDGKMLQTAQNETTGAVQFSDLSFTAPGEYRFTIEEQVPAPVPTGYQFDAAVYTLSITITDLGNGQMAAESHLTLNGQAAESPIFVNVFQPTPPPIPSYPVIQVPLQVQKILQNGRLNPGQFTFLLKDATGKVLAEASNDENGLVTFPDRTFSRVVSKYRYTIQERMDAQPGIQYDSSVYTVYITTTAVNGRLQAQVDIHQNGTPYAGAMDFVNIKNVPQTGDPNLRIILSLLLTSLVLGTGALLVRRRRKLG